MKVIDLNWWTVFITLNWNEINEKLSFSAPAYKHETHSENILLGI